MRDLRIAAPAARDLAALVDYIAKDNPAAAEATYRGIVQTARKLPQFPAMGRPGRHPNTREISVANLPYLIVYNVTPKAMTILAIFHTSHDLGREIQVRLARD